MYIINIFKKIIENIKNKNYLDTINELSKGILPKVKILKESIICVKISDEQLFDCMNMNIVYYIIFRKNQIYQ